MHEQSLFQYIKANTDNNGVFTAELLPDESEHLAAFFLGTDDSFYFTGLIEDKPADGLLESFAGYLETPSPANKKLLLQRITSGQLVEIYKSFLNEFSDLDHSSQVYELAKELFYTTNNRQVLKFALLLFSYEELPHIKNNDPELWQDILTVAHCEEFTYFFIAAGYDCLQQLQPELWEIARCCKNWGKVFALSEVTISTGEQKLWCIGNALDIEVDYPLLSAKIITECDIADVLQQSQLTYSLYKGAGNIINNFFALPEHYPLEEVEENFNIRQLDIFTMLQNFLHHGKNYTQSIASVMPLLILENNLHNLLQYDAWMILSANQCHELIAQCDKIIFHKDWQPDIHRQLINDSGQLDYPVCDFACRIGVDIWDKLFAYYCKHLEDINIFCYLLKTDDWQKINMLFARIRDHLAYYLLDPRVLTLPMLYVRDHSGFQADIVIEFLRSRSDYALVMSIGVLSSWQPDDLTAAICLALQEAKKYTKQEKLLSQIDCLLYRAKGIYLDSSDFN